MSIDQFLLSADTTDLNYPDVRPTLDLNFARTKTLDPRITFTRASGGSYVGADGLIKYAGVNEARFDHDPATSESLGLLIEEARTNLVTDSIILSNMPDKTNVTVKDNVITSPTGVQNVSKIIETNINGSHSLSRLNISTTSNVSYTISGYFKRAERKNVILVFRNNTFWGTPSRPGAIFNLESGTVLSTSGVLNSISIIYAGNGWYRCSITATRDNNGIITSGIVVGISNDAGAEFYQGIEGHGLYAWGLQFEAGSFVTSFIPTIGSTRTRAADNVTITGKNFSEWYRQDEGTIYSNIRIIGIQKTRFDRLWAITNSNLNQDGLGVFIGGPQGGYDITATINGITQYPELNSTLNSNNIEITPLNSPRLKSSFGFTVGNSNISYNGKFPNNFGVTLQKILIADRLFIGSPQRFQGTSCMTISRLTYYPKRLPNEQLQSLTR